MITEYNFVASIRNLSRAYAAAGLDTRLYHFNVSGTEAHPARVELQISRSLRCPCARARGRADHEIDASSHWQVTPVAHHTAEIRYVFGSFAAADFRALTPGELQLTQTMMGAWAAFAAAHDPARGAGWWPPTSAGVDSWVVLESAQGGRPSQLRVEQGRDQARLDMLDRLCGTDSYYDSRLHCRGAATSDAGVL